MKLTYWEAEFKGTYHKLSLNARGTKKKHVQAVRVVTLRADNSILLTLLYQKLCNEQHKKLNATHT
jgi:hypothetical protein